MKKKNSENEISVCPIMSAVGVIGGKWKIPIVYNLRSQTLRFGELRKKLPEITQKMLTQQLRELEADGLVERIVYAEVPPKVEYRLTKLARELSSVFLELQNWGKKLNRMDK
ncbi:MAG: winged helix-turn-helix transcriptional regulator [Bacteriovoracaceae bacterium]